jgi:hypothetical protein
MSLQWDVDVVIVGFGAAGAAATLAAASAGARVLVLDEGAHRAGRWPAGDAQRRAALRAGARVRRHTSVHELFVEAGRITGVGFAALRAGSLTAARYRWLRREGERAPGMLGEVAGRAADRLWLQTFGVGSVRCSAVVLAVDPLRWDFVGPAVWSAHAADQGSAAAGRRENLCLVHPEALAPPDAGRELVVRRWCADRGSGPGAAPTQHELRVDERSGAVLAADGRCVPGLFSAVPVSTGSVLALADPAAAGRGAVRAGERRIRPHLTSMG